MEPYHILNQVLVFFLVLDFLVRFIFPDPIQEIKPYLLLPVARRKCWYLPRHFGTGALQSVLAIPLCSLRLAYRYPLLRTDGGNRVSVGNLAAHGNELLLEPADTCLEEASLPASALGRTGLWHSGLAGISSGERLGEPFLHGLG